MGGEVKTITKIEKKNKENLKEWVLKNVIYLTSSLNQSEDLKRYSSNQIKLIAIKNINELNQLLVK